MLCPADEQLTQAPSGHLVRRRGRAPGRVLLRVQDAQAPAQPAAPVTSSETGPSPEGGAHAPASLGGPHPPRGAALGAPTPAGCSQGPHTPAEPPGGGWRARLLSLLQDEAVASTVTPWGAPSGVRLVPIIDGLGVHCQWLRITSGGTERGHGGPRIPRVTADSPGCKWHFRPFVEITQQRPGPA